MPTVNVIVQVGVAQTIRAEFMSLLPVIENRAVAAVAESRQRESGVGLAEGSL